MSRINAVWFSFHLNKELFNDRYYGGYFSSRSAS